MRSKGTCMHQSVYPMKLWMYLRTRIVRFSYNNQAYNYVILCYCTVYLLRQLQHHKYLGVGKFQCPSLCETLLCK